MIVPGVELTADGSVALACSGGLADVRLCGCGCGCPVAEAGIRVSTTNPATFLPSVSLGINLLSARDHDAGLVARIDAGGTPFAFPAAGSTLANTSRLRACSLASVNAYIATPEGHLDQAPFFTGDAAASVMDCSGEAQLALDDGSVATIGIAGMLVAARAGCVLDTIGINHERHNYASIAARDPIGGLDAPRATEDRGPAVRSPCVHSAFKVFVFGVVYADDITLRVVDGGGGLAVAPFYAGRRVVAAPPAPWARLVRLPTGTAFPDDPLDAQLLPLAPGSDWLALHPSLEREGDELVVPAGTTLRTNRRGYLLAAADLTHYLRSGDERRALHLGHVGSPNSLEYAVDSLGAVTSSHSVTAIEGGGVVPAHTRVFSVASFPDARVRQRAGEVDADIEIVHDIDLEVASRLDGYALSGPGDAPAAVAPSGAPDPIDHPEPELEAERGDIGTVYRLCGDPCVEILVPGEQAHRFAEHGGRQHERHAVTTYHPVRDAAALAPGARLYTLVPADGPGCGDAPETWPVYADCENAAETIRVDEAAMPAGARTARVGERVYSRTARREAGATTPVDAWLFEDCPEPAGGPVYKRCPGGVNVPPGPNTGVRIPAAGGAPFVRTVSVLAPDGVCDFYRFAVLYWFKIAEDGDAPVHGGELRSVEPVDGCGENVVQACPFDGDGNPGDPTLPGGLARVQGDPMGPQLAHFGGGCCG